eukprot:gene16494-22514_t
MSSGYENAPITKVLSVLTAILSIIVSPYSAQLDLPHLYRGELWRLISGQLIFQSLPQTVVGLILLYTCRQFERQMGIRKFGAFLFFSFLISTSILLAMIVTASSVGYEFIPSCGPYFIIFSLLSFYYWHIPKLHSSQFSVFGMEFSEKSWIYFLSLQLLLSDGVESIAAALSGFVAGYIYDTDGYGLQNFRLPRRIENFFAVIGRFFTSLFPANNPTAIPTTIIPPSGSRRGNIPSGLNRRGPGGGNRENLLGGGGGWMDDFAQFEGAGSGFEQQTLQPRIPIIQPDEAAIANLMGLGFEREAVIRALIQTSNNVEAAANILLQ